MRLDERSDPELVAAALAGDRQAVADIYDRYATVVFTVCVRLLGNRDEAADCAADVFLRATERLHQLRDHEKLKSWLYAIARNEVARRQRQRGREVLVEAIDDLPWIPNDDADLDVGLDIGTPDVVTAGAGDRTGDGAVPIAAIGSTGAIERLIQEASAGLTDRDRIVAELGLRQNLQGEELAAALGVTTNHAYVLVHRVRGRLERAVTAVLVARTGRDDCPDLQRVLAGWDGDLTVLMRKRVARHIDACEVCGKRRKAVPAALFDAAPVLAAPIAIRQRVLAEAQVATATGRPWSADGFPRGAGGRRRALWLTGAAAILVVIALVALVATGGTDDSTLLADRSSVAVTSPPGPDGEPTGSTAGASTTTTAAVAPAPDPTAATDPTDPTDPSAPTSTGLPGGPGPGGDPSGPVPPVDPENPSPPAAGSLVASPASIDFGTSSTQQTLVLSNTGGTPLTFDLGGSSSRLSVSPAGGSVAPGASQTVTVGLDRSGLGDAFAAAVVGQAGGAPAVIVVTAANPQPPTIDSVAGPSQFSSSTAPACRITVAATDNTAVVSVRVEWTTTSPSGSGTVDLTDAPGDTWTGFITTAPPGSTITWRVVAVDAAGNATTSSPSAPTPVGSFCLP